MVAPALAVLLILCASVFTLNALSVRADLRHAEDSAQKLQQALADGDKPAASTALSSLQSSAHGARRSTGNILWKVAGWVPVLGKNAGALTDVTRSLDEISQEAMPPVVKVATQLDLNAFSPKKGKLDLTMLATLNAPIAQANSVLAAQKSDLANIRTDTLAGPVRTRVTQFITVINQAAEATRITHQALGLIPTMLGDTKRTYLVVFQNNAQIRATGGLPGSYLIANVKDGKISRGKQGTGSGLAALAKDAVPRTPAEKTGFNPYLARSFISTNFTPEFPRTAQFMRGIIKGDTGVRVDGVISLDPVAMSYLLAGTGPVKLKDGTTLTSENAVSELLNTSYLRFPLQNQSDDFFTDAAAKLFDFVIDGHGDAGQTIRGLVRAAKEERIYIWSDKPAEQSKITTMAVSGSLLPDAKNAPTLGVFLNDATGTKLEYYLRYATSVTPTQCNKDGSQVIGAHIDLASLAPVNAAQFPPSIVNDSLGVAKGNMLVTVNFYLPTGAKLMSVRTDTKVLGTATREQKDHPVYGIPFLLTPGQAASADISFRTPKGVSNDITVSSTPSAQAGRFVRVAPSLCN